MCPQKYFGYSVIYTTVYIVSTKKLWVRNVYTQLWIHNVMCPQSNFVHTMHVHN